jgi:hypothetical protein
MMKKMMKLLILSLILTSLIGCSSGSGAGDESQKNAILMALLEGSSTARDKCIMAVEVMNQCVGTGNNNQFNPANMCSTANLKTEADYTTLISCVSDRVAVTNCNFPQNKYANAALASTNVFSKDFSTAKASCNVSSIIVTDWYTLTTPTF